MPSFLRAAEFLSILADEQPKQSDLRGVSRLSFKLEIDSELQPNSQQKNDFTEAV
jgi:hypothetical protein